MKRRMMGEVRKFQVWADCHRHGWDRTTAEIAESVGISQALVSRSLSAAGWWNRLSTSQATRSSRQRSVQMRGLKHGTRFDENALELTDIYK